eukprot:scaffold447153_cov19-Prasinocladus_malaysianus.AAC.3
MILPPHACAASTRTLSEAALAVWPPLAKRGADHRPLGDSKWIPNTNAAGGLCAIRPSRREFRARRAQ